MPESPPIARLFLALWPDAGTTRRLVELQRLGEWTPLARATPPEHLHLTLHFIGGVPCERLPALAAALPQTAPRFELNLTHASVWPNGAAVIEPDGVPDTLSALHVQLGRVLVAQGIALETRPWRPHITLARKARGSIWPADLPPVPWRSSGYVLAESRNGYHALRIFR